MTGFKTQIRTFIVDNFLLGADKAAFGDDDSFLDLHLLDSTGFLELVDYVQETFGIKVADEEMMPENLDSLDSLDAYIARKLADRDAARLGATA